MSEKTREVKKFKIQCILKVCMVKLCRLLSWLVTTHEYFQWPGFLRHYLLNFIEKNEKGQSAMIGVKTHYDRIKKSDCSELIGTSSWSSMSWSCHLTTILKNTIIRRNAQIHSRTCATWWCINNVLASISIWSVCPVSDNSAYLWPSGPDMVNTGISIPGIEFGSVY